MRKDLCIKAFFAAALAATMVACTTLPPPDASVARRSAASKVGAKHVKVAKTTSRQARSAARSGQRTAADPGQTTATTGSPGAQRKTTSDPVTEKAKAAIAAMLDDPSSAEFYDLRRAQRNLLHRTVDSICGQVRTKQVGTKGGGRTGGMRFLYIIGQDREDEAYLVNGRSHVAETVHGAVCK